MAHPDPEDNTYEGKKPIVFATTHDSSKPWDKIQPSFVLTIPPIIPNQDTADDTNYQILPQDVLENMTTACVVKIYRYGKITIDITAPDKPFVINLTIQSSKIVTDEDIPMEKPEDCLTLFDQIHVFANVFKKDKNEYTHINASYNPAVKKNYIEVELGKGNLHEKDDQPLRYSTDNVPSLDYLSLVSLFSDLVNISVNTKNEFTIDVFCRPVVDNDNTTADDTDPHCTHLSTTLDVTPTDDSATPESC